MSRIASIIVGASILLTACSSAASTSGCPATFERQVVELSGKVSSAIAVGFLRYTTIEDGAHVLCMIHSERFVGDAGADVKLSALIALPVHGIWTAPYLVFKDEYDKLEK